LATKCRLPASTVASCERARGQIQLTADGIYIAVVRQALRPQITVGNEAYPQTLGLHRDEQQLFAAHL
jgi:hypothetical protein